MNESSPLRRDREKVGDIRNRGNFVIAQVRILALHKAKASGGISVELINLY